MFLSRMEVPDGSKRSKKRVGRGSGSGSGKTSGRGHKGQRARSGSKTIKGFEGGQMPLQRRLPKRGFRNRFKEYYSIINIKDFNKIGNERTIDPQYLKEKGLIKNLNKKVKILGEGELTIPFTVKAHKFSASAKDKIEKAGGKIEVL